jgi:hypothetical protein
MLRTIQGFYRNGRVELNEVPEGVTESEVFVTFLTERSINSKHQPMSFGMFRGEHQSTEADFKEAEFQPSNHDGLDWS